MQIDFISDTVCPWCFIGKRRLARAMAMRPNIAFDVRWRPYRLDPTVPKGGMDRAGLSARQVRRRSHADRGDAQADRRRRRQGRHRVRFRRHPRRAQHAGFPPPDPLGGSSPACRTKWWSGCSSPISRMARISATSASWPTSPISAAWTASEVAEMLESDTDRRAGGARRPDRP